MMALVCLTVPAPFHTINCPAVSSVLETSPQGLDKVQDALCGSSDSARVRDVDFDTGSFRSFVFIDGNLL